MYPGKLTPDLDLLREEYVLIQAWKKTASHIRQRSWTVDTLALDHASMNLQSFIGGIRERLLSCDTWQNEPLRMVVAPKSQDWHLPNGVWEPRVKKEIAKRIRPLAYVKLADQVVATALMLCIADRVETRQGDTRGKIEDAHVRQSVNSYGNRLFCDRENGDLTHRWGSGKLYRAYYQDYRTFLSRPETVANLLSPSKSERVIVSADLKQFYDRVRPSMMVEALDRIKCCNDDKRFYSMATSVLDWSWDSRDQKDVNEYANQSDIADFNRISLPQGLVAAGFFANVLLLTFDEAMRSFFDSDIHQRVRLLDACRYVDDLKILVEIRPKKMFSQIEVEKLITHWLEEIIDEQVPNLELSPDKTEAIFLDREERPLIRQRAAMRRIQKTISEGPDLNDSLESLYGLRGLVNTQESTYPQDSTTWRFSPIPDVREDTVVRFSAFRHLNLYRSLRPRLKDERPSTRLAQESVETERDDDETEYKEPEDVVPTKRELDESTAVFAYSLIERWLKNPSNVRVLLVGLDLCLDVSVLDDILEKLNYYVVPKNRRPKRALKQVAWYCLAEILRAGATHTGFVADKESLPSNVDLDLYRQRLYAAATNLVELHGSKIPWYLRQQALLYLATYDPKSAKLNRKGLSPEITEYRKLIRFLRGDFNQFSIPDFATLAVLCRRSFLDRKSAAELIAPKLSRSQLVEIAERDPSFCYELIESKGNTINLRNFPRRLKEDLCFSSHAPKHSLEEYVITNSENENSSLRSELSVLQFAKTFLESWRELDDAPAVITPSQVFFVSNRSSKQSDWNRLEIRESRAKETNSLYSVPYWCDPTEKWRIQLGFLIRFILAANRDFTRPVWKVHWREGRSCYRKAESHWYQRIHGMYSAQAAFGDDWLPISEWLEGLLLGLLRWPGCRVAKEFGWVSHGLEITQEQITHRIKCLTTCRGKSSNLMMLPMKIKRASLKNKNRASLRICVVQTAIPQVSHFCKSDLALSDEKIRRDHRNHLSATLSAVKRMHALRESHKTDQGQIDLLILPELAVHPDDIRTHIIPFAKAHKTIVLTGLTYEEIFPNQPLVNSAMWIVPQRSESDGLQVITRRQGKGILAPEELKFNKGGTKRIRGFRPCQWLIGFHWSTDKTAPPLWLTASVCYDATDLALVTDLRDRSDVFIIPALNKDVKTFDQMALALHYHMFQLVVVANNGQYGGSNAYWPTKESRERQIFHVHGQPQATISFFEIDNVAELINRRQIPVARIEKRDKDSSRGEPLWKNPPAGIKTVESTNHKKEK